MVQGVQDAVQLIIQAFGYLAYENKIFGVWASITLICMLIIFFVRKLTNNDN